MKKLMALLLSAAMMLSLAACGEQKEDTNKLEEIKAAGELVIGVSADYPPAEYHTEVDGVDTIVGYDIDIAKYIADDLGVDLKIVDMAFDSLCISLSQGEFDMVISSMAATPERSKSVDFSDPYYTADQLILARKDDLDKYNTVEDVKGKTIGVQKGATMVPIAESLTDQDKVIGLVKVQDVIMELQHGKVDIALIDPMPAMAYAAANGDIDVKDIGIEVDAEGQCIGIQKGNEEFVEYVNGVLNKAIDEGLVEKWMADSQLAAGIEG